VTPDELRLLAEEATPNHWWATGHTIQAHRPGHATPALVATTNPRDARLIALAPDLARLCADAYDALRYIAGYDVAGYEPHQHEQDVAVAAFAKLAELKA